MKQAHNLYSLAALGMLWIGVSGLSRGLGTSLRGMSEYVFLPVATFGILLGWLLARVAWKPWKAWLIILLIGFMYVFFDNAKLSGPLLVIFKSMPSFEIRAAREIFLRKPVDLDIINVPLDTLLSRSLPLWRNIGIWIQTIFSGQIPSSLAAWKFLWSSVVLALSAWAAWFGRRNHHAFAALGPAICVTALTVDYSEVSIAPLLIEMVALLSLAGIYRSRQLEIRSIHHFSKLGDSSNSLIALVILSTIVTLLAGATPSLSINKIVEGNKSIQSERERQALAEKLGLKAPTGKHEFGSSGLPREHLIGLDPARLQNIVLRIQTGELPPLREERLQLPAPRHYWRSLTYDIYTGAGWKTSLAQSDRYLANHKLSETFPSGYSLILQSVKKAPGLGEQIFWTGTLMSLDQPYETAWRTDQDKPEESRSMFISRDLIGAVTTSQEYTALSIVPQYSVEQLRASNANYPPDIMEHYLALPGGIPDRVLELAGNLTRGIDNPYGRAMILENFIRTYTYSLDVPAPPGDRDIVDYFLFDLRKGYCDYFASSMVVLARASGLPARIVIGYAPGSYNAVEAEYVIREADAHSWVEIYFNSLGWIEFEPTSNQSPFQYPSRFPSISANQVQSSIMGSADKKSANNNANTGYFLFWLIVIVFCPVLGYFIWKSLYKSDEQLIFDIFKQVVLLGRNIAWPVKTYETPSEFTSRLNVRLRQVQDNKFLNRFTAPAADELEILKDLYENSLYGPALPTKRNAKLAVSIWRRLYWRLILVRWLI